MKQGGEVGFRNGSLMLDGEEVSVYAGEFHYFRVRAEDWHDRLKKVKEANFNTVSTYIPWNWHEHKEGEFDFMGETDARRNLVGFLELVEKEGLCLLARPGPAIIAEWRNSGIPEWLLDKHPEIRSLDAEGRPTTDKRDCFPDITLLHPTYLRYVDKWYDSVCDILRGHLYTRGGCIIMVQLDNEIHFNTHRFERLNGYRYEADPVALDYNPYYVGDTNGPGLFQLWLARKYDHKVELLNKSYSSSFSSFDEVQPPRKKPEHYTELPRLFDWFRFKEHTVLEFLNKLRESMVAKGIDVPFYLNDPFLLTELITCVKDIPHYFDGKKPPLIIGPDLYPCISNIETVWKIPLHRSVQKQGPIVGYEVDPIYSVDPKELDILYRLMIALGLDGFCYYMLVGGHTPTGYTAWTGDAYEPGAAIGPEGRVGETYSVFKKFGELLSTHGTSLSKAKTESELTLAIYHPYSVCGSSCGDTSQIGFIENVFRSFEYFFVGGLVPLLIKSGIAFDVIDIEDARLEELLEHRVLWVMSMDFMDAQTQRKLANYVKGGGTLILHPITPYLDTEMRPCTILNDEIFRANLKREVKAVPLSARAGSVVETESVGQAYVWDYIASFNLPEHSEALAFTEDREVCGYLRKAGKGKAILLGFKLRSFYYGAYEIPFLLSDILRIAGAQKTVQSTNPEVQTISRASEDYAYLFLFNGIINKNVVSPFSQRQTYVWNPTKRTKITYKLKNGNSVEFPNRMQDISMPGGSALMLPVNCKIAENVVIKYATSEVLATRLSDGRLEIKLQGPEGTRGEIALRIECEPTLAQTNEVPVSDEDRFWDSKEKTLYLTYNHRSHPTTITLVMSNTG